MSKFTKSGIVIAFILAVLSVSTSIMLAVKEMKYRTVISKHDSQLKQNQANASVVKKNMDKVKALTEKNRTLAEQANKLRKELDKKQSLLSDLNIELENKTERLEQLIAEKKNAVNAQDSDCANEMLDQIAQLKEKMGKAQEEIQATRTKQEKFQQRIEKLTKELELKEAIIAQSQERETDLRDLAQSLKSQIEQLKDISQQQHRGSHGKLEAAVEVVNREMKFIVFGMGERDGLSVGDVLNVYRSGKYLGSVYVDEVFQNMASATISNDLLEYNISEGDIVRK